MADREDPLVAFKFGLEIEGKMSGFFTSVSGIGSESEVVEHKVVNPDTGETILQKIPGRLTWTDVSLKRGVTSAVDVWAWRQSIVDGGVDEARDPHERPIAQEMRHQNAITCEYQYCCRKAQVQHRPSEQAAIKKASAGDNYQ